MSDSELKYIHVAGDRLLSLLSNVDGLVGEFVRNFPGKVVEASSDWLQEWFLKRTNAFLGDQVGDGGQQLVGPEDVLPGLMQVQAAVVTRPVKLLSLRPHYFRGFRNISEPIDLSSSLVVVDGRNSSGKTSLAEAFEWLLTGELIRRDMQQQGNARELENCIGNQLKPAGEETWVEAVLQSDAGERMSLKRVLMRDYGATQTATPQSTLWFDGRELSLAEEAELLDDLFAGVPPLLMQHTLRLFVHSTPAERRSYFERLLQLDELTYLIEKAVIGNARLAEFPGPSGGVSWKQWENLRNSVQQPASRTTLRNAERGSAPELQATLGIALISVASTEFAALVSAQDTLEQARQNLLEEQRKVRQRRFPILERLRPQQGVDSRLLADFSPEPVREKLATVEATGTAWSTAREAASLVGEAQIAIARAFEQLAQAGMIVEIEAQTCPMCNYEPVPTLTARRRKEISSWQPVQRAASEAEKNFTSAVQVLKGCLDTMMDSRKLLIPSLPSDADWDASLETVTPLVSETAVEFRRTMADIHTDLEPFDADIASLLEVLDQLSDDWPKPEQAKTCLRSLEAQLNLVLSKAREYLAGFEALEKAAASLVREDPDYSLRRLWLSVVDDLDVTVADMKWERAKAAAQAELQCIRDALIQARQAFLEGRRVDFNTGITSVWSKLRSDRYSAFSNLCIPEPRGKGFPVEIEVKAILDDGTQQREVDALRVFSESQVNVLGIAAFVTRSRLLGHRTLILDDPVQSMDEDHFKTFATDVLQHLIDEGFQVVLLTHNDTFAREVSYACLDLDCYVTMRIRHSRRSGCQVDEGSRRVAERLKTARRKGEDGKLNEAWRYIRLSLERLYTVIYKKHGPPDFNPLSWLDQTAESMWNSGVGEIVEEMVPGTGGRLKEILSMAVAGAHDKHPKGFTDLDNAIKDIRRLLTPLRVGDG